MTMLRATFIALAVSCGMMCLAIASPARADWDGHRGWHHHWYGPGWGWPGYYYYRPPVVYAPPPVYYAPPPPPPPVYYTPGVSFGVTIH